MFAVTIHPLEISVLWKLQRRQSCPSSKCWKEFYDQCFPIFLFSCLNVCRRLCPSPFSFSHLSFYSCHSTSPFNASICPPIWLSICLFRQWVQGQLHPGPAGSGQTGRLQGWWPHHGRGELRRITFSVSFIPALFGLCLSCGKTDQMYCIFIESYMCVSDSCAVCLSVGSR